MVYNSSISRFILLPRSLDMSRIFFRQLHDLQFQKRLRLIDFPALTDNGNWICDSNIVRFY